MFDDDDLDDLDDLDDDPEPDSTGIDDWMADEARQYRELTGQDHVPSSVESTERMLDGVLELSPEQLQDASSRLEGIDAENRIRSSVFDQEAVHRAHVEMDSAIAEAERLAGRG